MNDLNLQYTDEVGYANENFINLIMFLRVDWMFFNNINILYIYSSSTSCLLTEDYWMKFFSLVRRSSLWYYIWSLKRMVWRVWVLIFITAHFHLKFFFIFLIDLKILKHTYRSNKDNTRKLFLCSSSYTLIVVHNNDNILCCLCDFRILQKMH